MSEEDTGLQINVPPDQEAGAYANFLTVWHSAHEFTLDFSTLYPADTGTLQARVVSRVKIAPTLVFEIMRALNENMTRYEAKYGEIKRPRTPEGVDEPGTKEEDDGADS